LLGLPTLMMGIFTNRSKLFKCVDDRRDNLSDPKDYNFSNQHAVVNRSKLHSMWFHLGDSISISSQKMWRNFSSLSLQLKSQTHGAKPC
jgi:hypothetical protein